MSFKTFGLGVKVQQAYLRWVCWTFKFDLSSTKKCDKIHSNYCYKLGYPQLDGSNPITGTAREALKIAPKRKNSAQKPFSAEMYLFFDKFFLKQLRLLKHWD